MVWATRDDARRSRLLDTLSTGVEQRFSRLGPRRGAICRAVMDLCDCNCILNGLDEDHVVPCLFFMRMLYEHRFMVHSTLQRWSRRERRGFASFSVGVRARVASMLVIISVLVAFGMRLSHMLLVHHAICEHGHLIDERRTTTNHEKVRASAVVRGSDLGDDAQDRDAGNGEDDDDHCDVMSVLHRNDGSSIIPCVTTLCWFDPVGIEEARETHPIDVIMLAPKSSPPVV